MEGCLDGKECDAFALVDVHIWLLLLANDLVLMSKIEVGRQQQLDLLQQFCAKCGLTMNVENKEVMVFNSVDPC
jgi:hypothetical protein